MPTSGAGSWPTASHAPDVPAAATTSVPVRQWVLSVPKRLRYFLHRDPKAAGAVLHILLRALRRTLRDCSPGAGPGARFGAVSFLHRFHEATALTRADVDALQETVRRRILRWFRRQGLLEEHTVREMLGWDHAGGFSLDASVRIAAHDRAGLERLLRYCARPPFALNRIEWRDAGGSDGEGVVLYRLPRPAPDGRTVIRLSPLELLDRLATLVPPPRVHRHRYHGVLAPNSPLRSAVVASAGETGSLPFPQTTPPRLLAAFGTDRDRFPAATDIQCYSGIAPVRVKSGKTTFTIRWRWGAPTFLRQTFHEFAGQSIMYSDWARAYYDQQRERGKDHHAAVRSLAFKWQRILWRCWQDRTPYDEDRYLRALQRRGSPLADRLGLAAAA